LPGEDKNSKACQIFQACQGVPGGLIVVEARSLFAAPQSINRALTLLDPGFNDELFVLFQGVCDWQQLVVDLGFKLSGDPPDLGQQLEILFSADPRWCAWPQPSTLAIWRFTESDGGEVK
jgi:hypothetical protein